MDGLQSFTKPKIRLLTAYGAVTSGRALASG